MVRKQKLYNITIRDIIVFDDSITNLDTQPPFDYYGWLLCPRGGCILVSLCWAFGDIPLPTGTHNSSRWNCLGNGHDCWLPVRVHWTISWCISNTKDALHGAPSSSDDDVRIICTNLQHTFCTPHNSTKMYVHHIIILQIWSFSTSLDHAIWSKAQLPEDGPKYW